MIFDLNVLAQRPKPCELDAFVYLSLSTFIVKSVAGFLRNSGETDQTGLNLFSFLAMAHDVLRQLRLN